MPSTKTDYRSIVRTGLFGRDVNVSLVAALLAVPLALGTAWWAGATVGADQFAEWTVATLTGESTHSVVFLAAAALVALGTVSGAVNSGFLPTYLLVVSPLFGVGLARYGTEYTVVDRTYVVSFGDAFADGLGAAIVIGLPVAAVGFLLGAAVRRGIESASGRFGGGVRPSEA